MKKHVSIGRINDSIDNYIDVINNNLKFSIETDAQKAIEKCYKYLQKTISEKDASIYGINTGFGSLCNVQISKKNLKQLQENLVMSHACGTGDLVPIEIVRLIMILKVKSLSQGYSGVNLATVEKILELYNKEIYPVIYTQGSLGASGDLAPLAHLALAIIGKGKVYYKNKITDTKKVFKKENIKPIVLGAKEGLALLNGTQFSLAYALYATLHGEKLWNLANKIMATSLDGFRGDLDPFDADIHKIRGQKGQILTAKIIRSLLKGSKIAKLDRIDIQDPYSFRCVPQVHGASYDTLEYVKTIVSREINATTDNPNIFADKDKILSGGNFHAQPLALPLDFLAIAMAELGNISERRTYKLVNGDRELPSYLSKNSGLNSGFMIAQYTAASIVSQNKQYCTPASIDSIVSSKGQEDHVSMAANAGTKMYKIIENLYTILSIEYMLAVQALDFRRPLKSSKKIEEMAARYRAIVPELKNDRILHDDIMKTRDFLNKEQL